MGTHVVETTVGVTICDNLNGSLGTVGDVQGLRDNYISQAELSEAFLQEGWYDDGVEGGTNIFTDGNEDFDVGLVVAHGETDLSTGQWPGGAVGRDCVLASAGEGTQDVLIETTRSRVVENEVSRRSSSESEGDERLHVGLDN